MVDTVRLLLGFQALFGPASLVDPTSVLVPFGLQDGSGLRLELHSFSGGKICIGPACATNPLVYYETLGSDVGTLRFRESDDVVSGV
jgi:hypothetical protein